MSFYSIKLFVDEERSRLVGRVYMHLTYDQRLAIKQMLERGNSKKEIAESIGVHTSTIYREIDRGTVNGHYDPTAAEEAYQEKLAEKGPTAVLEENPELANYIAKLILNQKLSPEKIVNVVKENPRFSKISLTKQTIYHSIITGKIPGVTKDSLRTEVSTIFSNGQICIPKWVLEALKLKDGDVLDLNLKENGEIVYKKRGT